MSSMGLIAKYKFIELSMIYSTKQSQCENDSISRVHAKILIGICLTSYGLIAAVYIISVLQIVPL